MRQTGRIAGTVLGAALLGMAGGLVLARQRQRTYRSELFDNRSWRRLAALNWIERNSDRSSLALLRDYLSWEPRPSLQARAARVIRSLEMLA